MQSLLLDYPVSFVPGLARCSSALCFKSNIHIDDWKFAILRPPNNIEVTRLFETLVDAVDKHGIWNSEVIGIEYMLCYDLFVETHQ